MTRASRFHRSRRRRSDRVTRRSRQLQQRRLLLESLENRHLLAATFEINGLFDTGSAVVDHSSITGDDRGGIAVSDTHVFYTGDGATGRFSAVDLSGGASIGSRLDAMTSNLLTGDLYSLGTGPATPSTGSGTITHLLAHDGSTGALTGSSLPLSTSVVVSNGTGIFAGADRILLHDDGTNNVYEIDLTLGNEGAVANLGTLSDPIHNSCENWAYWGVAEHFGGEDYVAYVSGSTVRRTRISDGVTSTIATFPGGLSDMCSFTVSPDFDRWYFHYEGSTTTFGGTSETIGYADGDFNTNIQIEHVGPDPRSTAIDTLAVNFDVAVDPTTFDHNDISLTLDGGSNLITPSVAVTQLGATQFLINGLTSITGAEGAYQLRVDGSGILDTVGNAIDGRDGERWTLDSTYAELTTANRPRGSLIYEGTEVRSLLDGTLNDIQSLTLEVDVNQTISVVTEVDAGLQVAVEVVDPSNIVIDSGTASTAGEKVILQTVPVETAGSYTINFRAVGNTVGQFEANAVLNASVEIEADGGNQNDTLATAQDIDTSLVELTPLAERGAVLGQGGRVLHAISRVDTQLRTINPVTGQTIGTQALTLDNGTVYGYNRGLAVDPTTGILWGLLQTSNGTDDLVTIDPETAVATSVGLINVSGRRFGEIAFDMNGELYAITGGGGSNASTLFHIDKTNPTSQTLLHTFSAQGAGGVTLNPDDGLLYRLQRGVFESIAVSPSAATVTNIPVSGALPTGRGVVQGMVYLGNGEFFLIGEYDDFYTIDTSGQGTLVALNNDFSRIHGLAITGATDVDNYSMTLASGDVVTITLDSRIQAIGNVTFGHTLELVDAAGTTIATGATAGSGNRLVISDFTVSSDGTYYLRVSGDITSTLGYSVVVTRNASFDTEPNNQISSAQSLDATGVVLGHVHRDTGLYAVDGPRSASTLYLLDPGTGQVVETLGPTGFNNVKSLDFDPATGILYGYADNVGLIQIDPSTGAGTLIGGGQQYTNISFDSNGTLYGSSPTHRNPGIWTIDLSSGVGTQLFNFGDRHRYAVAVDPNDQLWLRDDNRLFTIDLGSNSVSNTATNITGYVGGNFYRAGEFDPISGVYYDVTLQDRINGPSTLHAIDSATGAATPLGAADIGISALSFAPFNAGVGGDFYRFTVAAGDQIDLSTLTPGDGSGEFVNELDPMLELYDPNGTLVASDDNSAADGRNAQLIYNATTAGAYTVRVIGVQTNGEYVLQLNPNQNPNSDPGTPSNIDEGSDLFLDASNSFDPDPGDSIVSFDWDLDNDGQFDDLSTASATATIPWPTLVGLGIDDGLATYTIGLQVTDQHGATDTATTTFDVLNTAPTLTVSGALSTNEGSTYTLNLYSSDPGDDTISHWTINWGDGLGDQIVSGSSSTVDHVYPDGPASYTILATATDEDGSYDATFTGSNAQVSVDPAFADNGQRIVDFFDSTADYGTQSLQQPDGKILVAGYLSGGIQNLGIARYNTDGSLDTTFGVGGRVITDFGLSENATGMAFDSQGRLLIAGSFGIARFFLQADSPNGIAAGDLDTSYGAGGRNSLFTNIRYMQQDNQGRLVVSDGNYLQRFEENGSADLTFNGGDRLYTRDNMVLGEFTRALAVDSNDDIVLAAYRYVPAQTGQLDHYDMEVVRITEAGGLDTGFGDANAGNKATIDFDGRRDFPRLLETQNDKVLVIGTTEPVYDSSLGQSVDPSYDSSDPTDLESLSTDVAVVRLNADGTIDQTFSPGGPAGDGYLQFDARYAYDGTLSGYDYVYSASTTSNDEILLAGYFSGSGWIRLSNDGQLDTSIGNSTVSPGRVSTSIYYYGINSIYEDANNEIVLGGYRGGVSGEGNNFALSRYDSDGNLDTTGFGTSGLTLTDFQGSTSDEARRLMVSLTDGSVLVAGYKQAGVTELVLAKYDANGNLDPLFGSSDGDGFDGIVLDATVRSPTALQVDHQGRILVAYSNRVYRYSADGTRDTSFASSGFRSTSLNYISDLAIDSSGDVIVVGNDYEYGVGGTGTEDMAVTRIFSNDDAGNGISAGDIDTSFGTGGLTRINIGGMGRYSSGRVTVVNGEATFTSSPNALFTTGSILLIDDAGVRHAYEVLSRSGNTFTLDDSSANYVSGTGYRLYGGGNRTATGGTIEVSGGTVTLTAGTWPEWLADGDLLKIGDVAYSVASRNSDTELSLDDISLNVPAGTDYIVFSPRRSNDRFEGVTIDPDGQIVAVGYSYTNGYEGAAGTNRDFVVARINNDGTLDATFGVGSSSDSSGRVTEVIDGLVMTDVNGASQNGRDILVDGNSHYLIGGDRYMARYTPTGTLDTSFGSGGTQYSSWQRADSLALDSDGNIVAAGNRYLSRFNPDGTPDTTFAPNGYLNVGNNTTINTLGLDASGRILVGGRRYDATSGNDLWVARYLTGGLSVTVVNVAPQNVSVTGTTSTDEGQSISLSASATDPANEHSATIYDPLTYTWSITRNGSAFLQTTGQNISFPAPDDGTYVATLTVDDGDGGTATTMHTTIVDNVAPSVVLNPVTSIDENGVATLTGTITDPSPVDTFTVDIDWGHADSPPATETIDLTNPPAHVTWNPTTRVFTATHQYLDDDPTSTTSDDYTIGVVVTDDDGGVSGASSVADLDQVFEGPANVALSFSQGTQVSQTFTVGQSGVLDSVQFRLQTPSGPLAGNLLYDIRDATGGTPQFGESPLIATGSIPMSSLPFPNGWVSASDLGIPVTAGQELAITLTTDQSSFSLAWQALDNDPSGYPQGAAFARSSTSFSWFDQGGDYLFRTSVLTASPGTPVTTSVTVNNVAPVFVTAEEPYVFVVNENSDAGTFIGDVNATDVGTLDTVTYSIVGGNSDHDGDSDGAFAINPSTGEITVNDKDDLDFETQASFTLTVQATDDDTGTATTIVTVNLNDLQTTVSIADAPGVSEGAAAWFTVTSTGDDINVGYSVNYSSSTGTAEVTDFNLVGSSLTSIGGELIGGGSTSVTVNTIEDAIVEDNETFTVSLDSVTGTNDVTIAVAANEAEGIIENDDTATLSIGDQTIVEGTGGTTTMTFTVSLDAEVEGGFDLAHALTLVDAEGTDLSVTTASPISFAGGAGETQTIDVDITTDAIVEDNETFTITLGDVTGTTAEQDANIATGDDATGTIVNDDSATLSIGDQTIVEGTGGTTTMTFTVSLDAEVEGGFDLAHALTLVDAEGTDLSVTTASPISFAGGAGETQTIDVNITTDAIVEDNETFTITLGDVTGTTAEQDANIATGDDATGTIVNDDTATLSISEVTETEADIDFSVQATVTLNAEVEGGLAVAYSSALGTAEASDVTVAGSSLNFTGTVGETQAIDVTIKGDNIVEDDETFTITLGDVSGTSDVQDAAITTGDVSNGLINNDDFFTGIVFDDLDNDGSYETADGDSGIEGVLMQLVNQTTGIVIDSDTTDASGRYKFDVTPPEGTYKIVEVVDELNDLGLLDGKESAGVNGGAVNNSQANNEITDIDVGSLETSASATDYLFAEIGVSDIFGTVWRDFNNDGALNFGEGGIEGVALSLSGTDDRGNTIAATAVSASDGSYAFVDLRPGTYAIEESQPADFQDGQDSLGQVTDFGLVTAVGDSGYLDGNDRFAGIELVPHSEGDRYNFGERPQAGEQIGDNVTATIGFWHNNRGEGLIRSLNGSAASTQLGDWLAATFPNMYGPGAFYDAARGDDQSMDLTGKTNAQVADVFQYLHKRNRKTAVVGGPVKVDAQVLAVALATYVTSEDLSGGNYAAAYGFTTSADGIGYTNFNVLGTLTTQEASDLGLTSVMDADGNATIIDILLATDTMAAEGLLYDADSDAEINAFELTLRQLANDLYTAMNEGSDIS
ncbi:MAG: hypothetical protein F9B45_18575 [Phycisphaera sp. RhM]|nr:hypothetical protein [Phycisphaera sp. RhM]